MLPNNWELLTSLFLHWWAGYRQTMLCVARTDSLYLVSLVKEPLWSQSVCEVTGSICEGPNVADDVIFPPIFLSQPHVQNPWSKSFLLMFHFFCFPLFASYKKGGIITNAALIVDLRTISDFSNSVFPAFLAYYKSVNLSLLSNEQTSALDPFPLGQFARNNKFNFSSQLRKFHFTE